MRARRSATVTALAGLALVLGQAGFVPSYAAGTVTWRPEAAPAGTGFWSNACLAQNSDAKTQLHGGLGAAEDRLDVAKTRAFVRAVGGDVSWQYAPGSGMAGLVLSVPTTTTKLSVRARATASQVTGRLVVFYKAPGSDAQTYDVGVSGPATLSEAWQTVDPSSSLTWYHHSSSRGLDGSAAWDDERGILFRSPPDQLSLTDFAAKRAGAGGTFLASFQFGCTGSGVQVDHLGVTDASGATDYDLSAQTTTTTLTASASRIDPGETTTLTGAVTGAFGTVSGGGFELQASPAGSAAFTTVQTSTATPPTFEVMPSETTAYRLRFGSTDDADASLSAPVTVEVGPGTGEVIGGAGGQDVRRDVQARADKRKVRRGGTVTVTGTVTPGSRIAVWLQERSGGKHRVRWQTVDRAKTGRKGGFKLRWEAEGRGKTVLRVRTTGPGAAASRHLTVKVKVPTRVSARLRPATVIVGHQFTVRGRSSTHRPGFRVLLQRKTNGSWHTIKRTRTDEDGRYLLRKRAGNETGTWRLRVRVKARHNFMADNSGLRELKVRSEPDPIPSPVSSAPPPSAAPDPTPTAPTPPGTGIG